MGNLLKSGSLNDIFQHPFIQSIRMQNLEEVVRDIYTYSGMLQNSTCIQSSNISQSPSQSLSPTCLRHTSVPALDLQLGASSSSSVNKQSETVDDEIGLLHLMKASDRSNDEFSFSGSNYASSANATLLLTSSISTRDLNIHFCHFNGFMVRISYNIGQLLGKGGLSNVYRGNLQIHKQHLDSDRDKVSAETSLTCVECAAQEKCLNIDVAVKKTLVTPEMLTSFDKLSKIAPILKMRHGINHPGLVRAFLIFFLSQDSVNEASRQLSPQTHQQQKIRSENHDPRSFFVLSILEISNYGNLSNKLNRCEQLSEMEIRNVLLGILPGIRYLHEEIGIVHNDVKPHNILLFSASSASGSRSEAQDSEIHYKLGDFGHSRVAQPVDKVVKRLHALRQQILSNSSCKRVLAGTVLYMSPEGCLGLDDSTSNDIWSIGITVFQLATGHLPWRLIEGSIPDIVRHGFLRKFSQGFLLAPDLTGGEDINHNTESSFDNNFKTFGPILEEIENSEFSPEFIDFVKSCLVEDFRNRPTCSSLLEHPFLTGSPPDIC